MSVLVTQICFLHLESCVYRPGGGLSQDWSADSSSPWAESYVPGYLLEQGLWGRRGGLPQGNPFETNGCIHGSVSRESLMMWMWACQFPTLMMRSPAVTVPQLRQPHPPTSASFTREWAVPASLQPVPQAVEPLQLSRQLLSSLGICP